MKYKNINPNTPMKIDPPPTAVSINTGDINVKIVKPINTVALTKSIVVLRMRNDRYLSGSKYACDSLSKPLTRYRPTPNLATKLSAICSDVVRL